MLFFNTQEEYKTVAAGLRRELKALGLTQATHNQVLEVVAKSMGHKSYAALLAAQPPKSDAPSVRVQDVAHPALAVGAKPYMVYAYNEEPAFLAELSRYAGYRLLNTGDLDFSCGNETLPLHGRTLSPMQGTVDDVWNCCAGVNYVLRSPDGSCEVEHDGQNSVNWDGQLTRRDTRGVRLWMNEDGNAVPEDQLVLVLESWADEGSINLLSEEVVEEYDLKSRDRLVDACFRWIRDNDQMQTALSELVYDQDWGGFSDAFTQYAEAVGKPGARNASVLGQAQWVAGFVMHVGEFKALRTQLLAEVR